MRLWFVQVDFKQFYAPDEQGGQVHRPCKTASKVHSMWALPTSIHILKHAACLITLVCIVLPWPQPTGASKGVSCSATWRFPQLGLVSAPPDLAWCK